MTIKCFILETIKEEWLLIKSFQRMINMRALNWWINSKDFQTRWRRFQSHLTINYLLVLKKMEIAVKSLILKQALSFENWHLVKASTLQTCNLCLVFSVSIENSSTHFSLRKEARLIWRSGNQKMESLISSILLQFTKVQVTIWFSLLKDSILQSRLMT